MCLQPYPGFYRLGLNRSQSLGVKWKWHLPALVLGLGQWGDPEVPKPPDSTH